MHVRHFVRVLFGIVYIWLVLSFFLGHVTSHHITINNAVLCCAMIYALWRIGFACVCVCACV